MNSPSSLLIVVPTLDSHNLLPRLLRSLQQQTWPYWRLLFIDGPSGPSHRNWLIQCCIDEPRCTWVEQSSTHTGIFGAMNQGFALASAEDWLLFWGSDDWAASTIALERAIGAIEEADFSIDLLICQGRYADVLTESLGRSTRFQSDGLLFTTSYRRALWLGSTPPHQATLFGPNARYHLDNYASGYRLSADLDYFLRLSKYPDICVQCLDLELVYMSDGGISSVRLRRRLFEVLCAYWSAFRLSLFVPFFMRYFRRIFSLFC